MPKDRKARPKKPGAVTLKAVAGLDTSELARALRRDCLVEVLGMEVAGDV